MSNHPNRSKVRDWPAHLRAFRAVHALSQAQLADLLMTTKRRIEDWEQGINTPAPFLSLALERLMQKIEATSSAATLS